VVAPVEALFDEPAVVGAVLVAFPALLLPDEHAPSARAAPNASVATARKC
jgi:hypothetical protein